MNDIDILRDYKPKTDQLSFIIEARRISHCRRIASG